MVRDVWIAYERFGYHLFIFSVLNLDRIVGKNGDFDSVRSGGWERRKIRQ